MGAQAKTIELINQRIAAGKAKVLTERELLHKLRLGMCPSAADLDVVTMAFRSSMAGSAVMLLVPVAGRGVFTRAKRIWLNGVEGFPGPAPNERLGVVDTLIFSEQSNRDASVVYNGADLILDLLDGNSIEVECLAEEGGTYDNSFRISDLQFARMYTYDSFIPPAKVNFDGLDGKGNEHWDNMCVGDKILLNKAEGIIVGEGTRSDKKNRSLSLVADLFDMDLNMLNNRDKVEDCFLQNTIAIPIPILDATIIDSITQYITNDANKDNESEGYTCEHAISEFLKEEILTKRFNLIDSAMAISR